MSARTFRTQLPWLLLTLALSIAVAACSGSSASKPEEQPPAKAAQSEAQQGAEEATTQSTPPEAQGTAAGEQAGTGQAGAEQGTQAAMRPMGAPPLPGNQVEIRRAWVQVRNAPDQNARAIALAFGNDRLEVVEQQGDWVRVKIQGNREGWIPFDSTQGQ